MKIPIIYQDENIVVINKPSGIVVNRAESVKQKTVQDWMEEEFKVQNLECKADEDEEFVNRSGVVHRLDKETSGVMVLSKTPIAFKSLKNQFKKRQTQKMYMALVHGELKPSKGTINLPLKRNPLNRRRFMVAADGKMGQTSYKVADKFKSKTEEEILTLVNLWPKTGRTHQLRVHLSTLGYPIVADQIYLGKRLSQDLVWCPRLFLHAQKLELNHPVANKKMKFETELAEDLATCLYKLPAASA